MPQPESVYQQEAMSTHSGSFGFFLLLLTTLPQACHLRSPSQNSPSVPPPASQKEHRDSTPHPGLTAGLQRGRHTAPSTK